MAQQIQVTIMGIVTALMILAVGVFAVFYIINQANTTITDPVMTNAINNTTQISTSIFNILGIVLVIAAIMGIISVVYNYIR